MTIDSLALSRCDFIKIDTSGMELPAIRGAHETISRLKPVLYVANEYKDRSPALIEALFELGYKLYWHVPRYYEPDNYYENAENTVGNLASMNMLCVHGSVTTDIQGLRPITSPHSDWRTAPQPQTTS
jgi:hypothetical protein